MASSSKEHQPPSATPKLFGRAFYESIGSPKMILAPMVDQSEFAWRMLTRSYLTSDTSRGLLAYTPMLHARLFQATPKFRNSFFQPLRTSLSTRPAPDFVASASERYLDGHPSFDRPLTVQFCANQPEELLEAARYVAPFCDAVDVNLGCPQAIARKGKYGAFLQDDWDLVYRLIHTLHVHLDVPVTAKIRILESHEKTLAYAKVILSAGASILTVHGRQRDQKGHNTGLADWSAIRYLRDHLPPETVLFANGNILRRADIDRCLEETGADGVMSAEGNLHDPTIFADPSPADVDSGDYWHGRNGTGGYRIDGVVRRYLDIIYRYVLEQPQPLRPPLFRPSRAATVLSQPVDRGERNDGPPAAKRQKGDRETGHSPNGGTVHTSSNATPTSAVPSPNLSAIQPHLFSLLRPMLSSHTDIRDALARCKHGDMAGYERVLGMVESAIQHGLEEYERHPEHDDGDTTATAAAPDTTNLESSAAMAQACRQPWWICQPYVRPLPAEALATGGMTLSKKDKRRMAQSKETAPAKRSDEPSPHMDETPAFDLSKQELPDLPASTVVCG